MAYYESLANPSQDLELFQNSIQTVLDLQPFSYNDSSKLWRPQKKWLTNCLPSYNHCIIPAVMWLKVNAWQPVHIYSGCCVLQSYNCDLWSFHLASDKQNQLKKPDSLNDYMICLMTMVENGHKTESVHAMTHLMTKMFSKFQSQLR